MEIDSFEIMAKWRSILSRMKATSFLLSQTLFSIFIAHRIAFNFKCVSGQVGRAFDWLLAPNTIYEPALEANAHSDTHTHMHMHFRSKYAFVFGAMCNKILDMIFICGVLEMVRRLVGGSLVKIHSELQSTISTKVNKYSMCKKNLDWLSEE